MLKINLQLFAKTKVADVIVPEVFNPYVIEQTAQLSALYQSGIISNNPELNRLAEAGGRLINMPFWNDLTGDDEILSDNQALTPDKIDSSQDVAALLMRGKAWSANDLAKALSGDDPMGAIGKLVAAYWARRWQVTLINILTGVFAAPSMAGNLRDISAENGASGIIGASTTIDALQLLGDSKDKLTAFTMHSAVQAKLAKDNLIAFNLDSEGKPTIPTYLGKRIVVDDGCPVANDIYDTYIFGEGAIGYGEGAAPVPTETDRDSLAGDDILINRRHFVLHPRGVRWMDAAVVGQGPTNAELANAANWNRVYENKNVRMVLFRHRIA